MKHAIGSGLRTAGCCAMSAGTSWIHLLLSGFLSELCTLRHSFFSSVLHGFHQYLSSRLG